jgi:hypothetical protein
MRLYWKIWYRIKWYWSDHAPEAIALIIIALWIVTLTIAAFRTAQKEQFYKDEITILSDYIEEQETNQHYLSMKMDSVYTKQLMIEREVINLAGRR